MKGISGIKRLQRKLAKLGVIGVTALGLLAGSAWLAGARASNPTVPTNPATLKEYLREFHRNPAKVMNTRLPVYDEFGNVVTDPGPTAEILHATPEQVWRAHKEIRERICKAAGRSCEPSASEIHTWTGLDENNQINKFLYEPTYLTKLSDMEAKGLLKSQVPRKPWSDSFWPTVKGLIARRWLEHGFPDSPTDFMVNYTYYLATPPGSNGINVMSPAEKYDMLVGDSSYRLTSANWASGKYTFDKEHSVPGWTGLCHGWAPASFMVPAPKRSVTVPAPNGTMITFYPSDIKALATEAWGSAAPQVNFAGSVCKRPRPAEDENGRVIDPACFDVNPATWHIGIVNQMGVDKRSFIFDSQYDYQVWNFPIYSYHYRYFNPQTLESTETLGGAAVPIKEYTIDKFSKYRDPATKYVVGIEMDIFYSKEASPSTKPVQEPVLESKKWVYDLELDANGTIIGGEWYSNFHPDFMWNVKPDSRPRAVGETELTDAITWDGQGPVPPELRQAARASSSQQQPVWPIVDTLIRLSQEQEPNP